MATLPLSVPAALALQCPRASQSPAGARAPAVVDPAQNPKVVSVTARHASTTDTIAPELAALLPTPVLPLRGLELCSPKYPIGAWPMLPLTSAPSSVATDPVSTLSSLLAAPPTETVTVRRKAVLRQSGSLHVPEPNISPQPPLSLQPSPTHLMWRSRSLPW